MKKSSLKKGATIITAVLILGSSTVFANGKRNSSSQQEMQQKPQIMKGRHQLPNNRQKNMQSDAMGTVTSVNSDSISVKNADGDIITISINPQTKIIQAPTKAEKEKFRAEQETLRKERQTTRQNADTTTKSETTRPSRDKTTHFEKTIMETTDISVGDWVTIQAFNTDTITLEAARICVTIVE